MTASDTAATAVETAMNSLSVGESSTATTAANEAKLAQRRLEKANKAAAKAAAAAASSDKASRAAAHGSGSSKKSSRGGRDESPTVQLSKALAYMLRHGTVKEGLKVRSDGYVPLDDVLARPKVAKLVMTESGKAPTLEDVRGVVEGNDKKRFELAQDDEGVWLVRAVQGHSIAEVTQLDHTALTLDNLHLLDDDVVTPSLTPGQLPSGVEIMHGTTRDAWTKIRQSGGLHRMQRNHIHLAKGRPTKSSAAVSGMRASSPVILHIDLVAALRDGMPFFLASNGAVLTSGKDDSGQLPLCYIIRAEDSKTGETTWEHKG